MENGFSSGSADDLERLRQRAAGLQEMMRGIQDAAPRRTEGTDHTGAVRVVVGQDGLPDSIQVEGRWQDRIRPEALGPAIAESAEQALHHRGEAWARTLERSGQSAGSGHYSSGPGEEPGAAPGAGSDPGLSASRSLGEIAEEVIGMLGSVRPPSPVSAQGQGTGPDRAVALTITRSGQVSCAVDARWAAERSSDQLNRALGQALAAAREELRSQSAGNPAPAGRVARISAEIDAAVGEETRSATKGINK